MRMDDSSFIQKELTGKSSEEKLREQLIAKFRERKGRNPTESELSDLISQFNDVVGGVADPNDGK